MARPGILFHNLSFKFDGGLRLGSLLRNYTVGFLRPILNRAVNDKTGCDENTGEHRQTPSAPNAKPACEQTAFPGATAKPPNCRRKTARAVHLPASVAETIL